MRASRSARRTRLVVYGLGARAYAYCRVFGQRRSRLADTGTASTSLLPAHTALSYARKYGRSGASTKSGPPLCDSQNSGLTLESTDSRPLERRHVDAENRTARIDTTPAARRSRG